MINLLTLSTKIVRRISNMANKKSIIPSDIDFIRILWCDNANIIRAKSIYNNSSQDSNYYVSISEAQQ